MTPKVTMFFAVFLPMIGTYAQPQTTPPAQIWPPEQNQVDCYVPTPAALTAMLQNGLDAMKNEKMPRIDCPNCTISLLYDINITATKPDSFAGIFWNVPGKYTKTWVQPRSISDANGEMVSEPQPAIRFMTSSAPHYYPQNWFFDPANRLGANYRIWQTSLRRSLLTVPGAQEP